MKRWSLPVVLALSLFAAACSSADESAAGVATLNDPVEAEAEQAASDEAGAASDEDQEQALMEFAQCMRDNGVPMGDPTVDTEGNLSLGGGFRDVEGLDRETIQGAREICGDLLEGVALGFQQQDRSEFEDLFLEYAECMRDEGYTDMPDSFGPGSDGPGSGSPGEEPPFDFEDPEFIAANEVCQEIFADSGIGRLGGGPGRAGGGNA